MATGCVGRHDQRDAAPPHCAGRSRCHFTQAADLPALRGAAFLVAAFLATTGVAATFFAGAFLAAVLTTAAFLAGVATVFLATTFVCTFTGALAGVLAGALGFAAALAGAFSTGAFTATTLLALPPAVSFYVRRAFLARATTLAMSSSENTPLTPEMAASFMPCLRPSL